MIVSLEKALHYRNGFILLAGTGVLGGATAIGVMAAGIWPGIFLQALGDIIFLVGLLRASAIQDAICRVPDTEKMRMLLDARACQIKKNFFILTGSKRWGVYEEQVLQKRKGREVQAYGLTSPYTDQYLSETGEEKAIRVVVLRMPKKNETVSIEI